jgi:hypothetical protein
MIIFLILNIAYLGRLMMARASSSWIVSGIMKQRTTFWMSKWAFARLVAIALLVASGS